MHREEDERHARAFRAQLLQHVESAHARPSRCRRSRRRDSGGESRRAAHRRRSRLRSNSKSSTSRTLHALGDHAMVVRDHEPRHFRFLQRGRRDCNGIRMHTCVPLPRVVSRIERFHREVLRVLRDLKRPRPRRRTASPAVMKPMPSSTTRSCASPSTIARLDLDRSRSRVPHRVAERFLRRAVERASAIASGRLSAFGVTHRSIVGPLRLAQRVAERAERGVEAGLVQHARMQVVRDLAHVLRERDQLVLHMRKTGSALRVGIAADRRELDRHRREPLVDVCRAGRARCASAPAPALR